MKAATAKAAGGVLAAVALWGAPLRAEDAPAHAHAEAAPVQAPAAEAPPERVRITYDLGGDCPSPDAFEQKLDERLGASWKASPSELARSVKISAAVEAGGSTVRMQYEDAHGRSIARSVNAPTCIEALSAMALIAALAVDAQVREPEPASSPHALPPAPAPHFEPPPKLAETTEEKPAPPHGIHETGARLSLAAGFGTSLSIGIGVEWGLVLPSGLTLRAGVEGRDTGSAPAANGRANFRAFTVRGEGCFAVALNSWLSFPLCGGLETGALTARGIVSPPAVTYTTPRTVPWLAVLLTPRLRLASRRTFLELVPEARVPLTRPDFSLESPPRAVYHVPWAALGASVTGGVRFH